MTPRESRKVAEAAFLEQVDVYAKEKTEENRFKLFDAAQAFIRAADEETRDYWD